MNRTEKSLAATLMFQGTSSDVGKSVMAAAFCRLFMQDGLRVAPFKSQNMSLNSYITVDGKEIGRAQGMQADASKIMASTDMNPILLKPKKDMQSQVVVHGKPLRDYDAREYRQDFLLQAESIVKQSLARLRSGYELVVIEGAGSPAEVNLKDRDIVNMRLAEWADAPVILIGDIDRGGVFAALVGTLEILSPAERNRVRGFIINKFRGDVSLLQPGLEWLEEKTGKPVLGVVPYLADLGLEDEDSASLDNRGTTRDSTQAQGQLLDIAVIRLPRISNFTDFDPFEQEFDVAVRYVYSTAQWGSPDVVILPGSKNTVDDLLFLRESGLADKIASYAAEGGRLVGICAGYQMMGQRLLDPEHIESDRSETTGLGLFPAETLFTPDKRTERVSGLTSMFADTEIPVSGYEIHMGVTTFSQAIRSPFRILSTSVSHNSHTDGAMSADQKVWGTYLHGIFENDVFRRNWLNELRKEKGWPTVIGKYEYQASREAAFDRLALHVRQHVNMEQIYRIIQFNDIDK